MIHFDLPKEKSSILKVIGIGGGGSNAVNYMHSQGIEGVNFIICNTDAQAISNSKVPNKIQLGPHLTQGLGAGANPEIGRQATEESLEEIRRILEVNTKMAFITAGMGGGTGTGGAPIIAQVCKDMGILTVGIVTTPFSYEGKKRIQQGEDGINRLKDYVDTLLVISNDKLRHQYGNLKMKEAFAKADNVLATAAKCITDVINSTGQINVDFADVCTVMKNGGVAILGSGAAEGENRAQRAIEQALNSPLLNDNDIRGAKWILININSCEGEHEFTMDEVDTIQSYLLSQAGPDTDVIMGLGYDNTLDSKIGITLIATGFEHKDPFMDEKAKSIKHPVKEEKIVMTLGQPEEEKRLYAQPALFPEDGADTVSVVLGQEPAQAPAAPQEKPDRMAPSLVETPAFTEVPFFAGRTVFPSQPAVPAKEERVVLQLSEDPISGKASGNNNQPVSSQPGNGQSVGDKSSNGQSDAAGRKFLSRPSNIYDDAAEDGRKEDKPQRMVMPKEDTPDFDMHLVIKEEPAAPKPAAARPPREEARPEPRQEPRPEARGEWAGKVPPAQDSSPAANEEADEQRKKAAERLQKLRNLSFNVNAQEGGNEFEAIPAYMRRNMELYNTVNSIENFYSNYTVKPSDNKQAEISTINTFLDGKKPD
jgi:cell division protein FtsZ